ncbi:MAG: type II toxin-antitoxin system HicB family antitoxin [Dehalococcoidia bacterium]
MAATFIRILLRAGLTDADDGGYYTVLVPALPGCITDGNTLEEALAHAREAISLHVDSLMASGEPVPSELTPPELVAVKV